MHNIWRKTSSIALSRVTMKCIFFYRNRVHQIACKYAENNRKITDARLIPGHKICFCQSSVHCTHTRCVYCSYHTKYGTTIWHACVIYVHMDGVSVAISLFIHTGYHIQCCQWRLTPQPKLSQNSISFSNSGFNVFTRALVDRWVWVSLSTAHFSWYAC